MPQLPLEDLYTDVIGKAQRGLNLPDDALAARIGMPETVIQKLKNGSMDEIVFAKVCRELNLDQDKLMTMARKEWTPGDVTVEGLEQFTTPFEDYAVNAYLVWDPATKIAAAFDTGSDAKEMADFVSRKGLTLDAIYITHTHGDHIADVNTLRTNNQTVWTCSKEPYEGEGAQQFDAGHEFNIGSLRVETKQTWGHSKGGVTYIVHGLKERLAIVGDAIFASSMGGGMISWADALATNRRYILANPDSTVICPGHGPLTTVGEEKQHNPFYPEFK
jgi:glyoxylase-like metal-dependent hydrolase (beta-lactamase superfamily II)